jgi:hypothetical protein
VKVFVVSKDSIIAERTVLGNQTQTAWLMSGKWWVCPPWHSLAEVATTPQPPARCEDAKRMLPALPRVQAKLPPPTLHEPLLIVLSKTSLRGIDGTWMPG